MGFALKGSLAKGRPDGIFGTETEKAIKEFQRGNRLDDDGVAGHDTIAAFDEIVTSNSMLEVPSRESDDAEFARNLATPISRSNTAYW